jgi:hypothetical protein
MKLNVIEALKSVNFITRELDFPINEVRLFIEELPTFEPVPWQLRGIFQEALEYENISKPLNPFTGNGDFEVYHTHIRFEYKVELKLRFYLCKLDTITLRMVRIKDNTILFNRFISCDRLKKLAYSDLLSLINGFNLDKKDLELARRMFELKVYTLMSMAFVHNFLYFPTYNCEVIAMGNALKDTVKAIEHIQNFVKGLGESLQEILSTAWTLGELL